MLPPSVFSPLFRLLMLISNKSSRHFFILLTKQNPYFFQGHISHLAPSSQSHLTSGGPRIQTGTGTLLSKIFWFVYIHQNHLNPRLFFFEANIWYLCWCTNRPRSVYTPQMMRNLRRDGDKVIVWLCNMFAERGFWVRVFQIRSETTTTVVEKLLRPFNLSKSASTTM